MKTAFLAWTGTGLLTATGLATLLRKHIVKVWKAILLSRDVIDIVEEGIRSSEDGKITQEEVQKITDLINKLQSDLKGGSK